MSIPVIIDTDPGVDDAVAILLAAASPEIDLLAITATFGNLDVATTTGNAMRLRTLAGLEQVPVASGAERPLVHPQAMRADSWHGADGLGGYTAELPEPDAPMNQRRAALLAADLILASDDPVTLVSIGPLTDTALLLATTPEVKANIGRIVVMGGSFSGGNTTGHAEFNVHCDPEAARRVLVEEDVETTLIPLDLTMRCCVDSAWLADLASAGPRCAALARIVAHYHSEYENYYGRDAVALHDSLAVLEAVLPGTLPVVPLPLEVVCDLGPARGMTLADHRREAIVPVRPVDVALGTSVSDDVIDTWSAEILRRLKSLG